VVHALEYSGAAVYSFAHLFAKLLQPGDSQWWALGTFKVTTVSVPVFC